MTATVEIMTKDRPHPDGILLPVVPTKSGYLSDEEFKDWQDKSKQAAAERLLIALENWCNQDVFRIWAESVRKFHKYSPLNTLLIWLQFPSFTRVASLKTWNEHKRKVLKGEKSIMVWYPVMKLMPARDDNGPIYNADGTPKMVEVVVSFRLGRVFDVSQTDGEPLPQLPMPTEYHGEDRVSRIGISLITQHLHTANIGYEVCAFDNAAKGSYNILTKHIKIREGLSVLDHFAVLLHETAHMIAFTRGRIGDNQSHDYAFGELIAEGAAAIVLGTLGYDTSQVAVPYLAHWLRPNGEIDPTEEAVATCRLAMNEMVRVADALLDWLTPITRETAVDPSKLWAEVTQ